MNWYKILCFIGVHTRCTISDEGISCLDCTFHKTRYEHIADLHAGGGW